jgi:chemotaxis signal transduction protein
MIDLSDRNIYFIISGKVYGLPVENVESVVGMPKIIPLPLATRETIGVFAHNKSVAVAVDMKLLIAGEKITSEEARCIVVEFNSECYGLLVDEIVDMPQTTIVNNIILIEIAEILEAVFAM